MLLAIDVGNTNIHLGLAHDTPPDANDDMWAVSWRARTVADKMTDEYFVLIRNFFNGSNYSFSDINAVIIASVVPPLTGTFIEFSERYLNLTPLVVGPGVKSGVQILMDNPLEVGADRVVNAAAVRALYGGPAIVIDFGTATTFDIMNADGDYIGGVIAPGIGLGHDVLVERTAKLPKVDLQPPPSAVGRNTIHAMQSGLFLGYLSMMEGMVGRLRKAMGEPRARVIATGGLAPLFAEHTDCIEQIAPNLTLEGLRVIYDLNTA